MAFTIYPISYIHACISTIYIITGARVVHKSYCVLTVLFFQGGHSPNTEDKGPSEGFIYTEASVQSLLYQG